MEISDAAGEPGPPYIRWAHSAMRMSPITGAHVQAFFPELPTRSSLPSPREPAAGEPSFLFRPWYRRMRIIYRGQRLVPRPAMNLRRITHWQHVVRLQGSGHLVGEFFRTTR